MKFLPDTTQTTYSTLMQKTIDSQWSALQNVSFISKIIKDKKYWYCQYVDINGVRRQRYVGADDATSKGVMNNSASIDSQLASVMQERKRLVAMIAAGGGNLERGRSAKIISKLSDAGVFDSGGILIGSYAFSCYGNMLGVIFDESMRRTEDMDLAYDRSIEIGFIRDLRDDIKDIAPEMIEPKQINPWVPPYEMIAPDGFKLEFLTPRADASDKAPIPIERFKINAQTLEFLDYLINDPVDSLVLYGAGIKVKVPDPAKYAIHKLAVSQLRSYLNPEKSRKDLLQATALIEYFIEENPGALILAIDLVKTRDDMFFSFVEKGIKSIKDENVKSRFLTEFWDIPSNGSHSKP